MKTYLPFLVAFFLLQIGFSQGLKGDTWAEALKNKQASVILTNVHLANFSESKDGKGSGVCFDIMDDFAAYVKEKHGVKVSYKYRPVSNTANFQLFLSAVESSEGGVFGLGPFLHPILQKVHACQVGVLWFAIALQSIIFLLAHSPTPNPNLRLTRLPTQITPWVLLHKLPPHFLANSAASTATARSCSAGVH